MEKDKIFFADNGLTSTSANHISNLAKEAYRTIENNLKGVTLYTTEISILGSANASTLKEGNDKVFLDTIEPSLLKIAELKSLIAWLREAIKAKERLISEANRTSSSDIANILGITLPDSPTSYTRLTEDDIIATWGIKQRNRYYYLDTLCSTIGKYIHPDMCFSDAIKDLRNVLTETHKAQGNGRDTVIYTRIPTVDIKDAEDTFFKLQEKYRGYQAELNSMKHQIEVALQEDDREKSQKEIEESKNYEAKMTAINAEIYAYKKELIKSMQSLKIVIPDSLKNVYESISKIGK